MRLIYMNNYRGFTKTIVPIKNTNFFVGENSTGKSSLLKLLRLLARHEFQFHPDFSIIEDDALGGFNDIVSAWSSDKSFFEIGVAVAGTSKKDTFDFRFRLYRFREKDGAPQISRYVEYAGRDILELIFDSKTTRYKIETSEAPVTSNEEAYALFNRIVTAGWSDDSGFKRFPRNVPPSPPLAFAVSLARSIKRGKGASIAETFFAEIPYITPIIWIAPIRSRPKRIYSGTSAVYSPEGDHAPFVLRKSLRVKTKSMQFAEKLVKFGETSGLFKTISAHSFSRSPQAPFELLVEFTGAELNISNVGYGVSQALPLVVEFLDKEKSAMFAVQQPEVHLHPRAQAALGDLVYQLAANRRHSFLIETHSDYLIDRFRLAMRRGRQQANAQLVFFQRTENGNTAISVPISSDGRYSQDQPQALREFFIKEESRLLDI